MTGQPDKRALDYSCILFAAWEYWLLRYGGGWFLACFAAVSAFTWAEWEYHVSWGRWGYFSCALFGMAAHTLTYGLARRRKRREELRFAEEARRRLALLARAEAEGDEQTARDCGYWLLILDAFREEHCRREARYQKKREQDVFHR